MHQPHKNAGNFESEQTETPTLEQTPGSTRSVYVLRQAVTIANPQSAAKENLTCASKAAYRFGVWFDKTRLWYAFSLVSTAPM